MARTALVPAAAALLLAGALALKVPPKKPLGVCGDNFRTPVVAFSQLTPSICHVYCVPSQLCRRDLYFRLHLGATREGNCKSEGFTEEAQYDETSNSIRAFFHKFDGVCEGMTVKKFRKPVLIPPAPPPQEQPQQDMPALPPAVQPMAPVSGNFEQEDPVMETTVPPMPGMPPLASPPQGSPTAAPEADPLVETTVPPLPEMPWIPEVTPPADSPPQGSLVALPEEAPPQEEAAAPPPPADSPPQGSPIAFPEEAPPQESAVPPPPDTSSMEVVMKAFNPLQGRSPLQDAPVAPLTVDPPQFSSEATSPVAALPDIPPLAPEPGAPPTLESLMTLPEPPMQGSEMGPA